MPASMPAKGPPRLTGGVRQGVLLSGPCAYCGDFLPTQVDHVVPLSRGGTHERFNLVPACKMCNMEKLDFTPTEWRDWRLSEGMCWPPQSMTDWLREFLAEHPPPPGYRERFLRGEIKF